MMNRERIDFRTVSIINSRLLGITDETGRKVERQAQGYSTSHLRDLGVVLCDGEGRIIAQGDWMPVHTAGAHIAIKAYLDKFKGDFHPDDFFIGNDAFILRFGHLIDWSFLRPVYYKGELMFFTYLRTHQADGGGAYQGSYFPRSFDIFAEGLCIPPLRVVEKGKEHKDLYELVLRNVRYPSAVYADNMLILAAMRKAEERLLQMCDEYGKDVIKAATSAILNMSEEAMRDAIRRIPGGTYKAARPIDCDGRRRDVPIWVRLSLTAKPDVGELVFDYSESDKQVEFVNSPLGQTWASTFSGVMFCVHPRMLRNEGAYRPLTVIAPEGTVVNPTWPATVGACGLMPAMQIMECIQLALAQIIPEEVCAAWTRHLSPILFGKQSDIKDPRTGADKYHWLCAFASDGSSGAIWGYDGWNSLGPINCGGNVFRSPMEIDEHNGPWRYKACEWLTDSAGDGQYRGGMGTYAEYHNTRDPATFRPGDEIVMTGNCDGENSTHFGLMGGHDSPPNEMWIIREGQKIRLHTVDIVTDIQAGDTIVTRSGGGGGVGNPLDRDVEKVKLDVMNEYVSLNRAREIYGVIMEPKTFQVDYEATKKLRERLREAKKSAGQAG